MYTALQKLGFNPYHGTELLKSVNKQHVKCWQDALTARYYTGKSIGLIEFEKLLANYDVRIGSLRSLTETIRIDQ